jgi:hypothetical protein
MELGYIRTAGGGNPAVLGPLSPLAVPLLLKPRDAAGARDQFAALAPVIERALGPEHPKTLAARNNLAYWT